MPPSPLIRPIRPEDFSDWKPLWDGYNAFYGRSGTNALPSEVTETTWDRFFDPAEPVFALVAELDGKLVGLAHYENRAHLLPRGPVHRTGGPGPGNRESAD
jgi:hypothetical protein